MERLKKVGRAVQVAFTPSPKVKVCEYIIRSFTDTEYGMAADWI